jgi:hypothetical protein
MACVRGLGFFSQTSQVSSFLFSSGTEVQYVLGHQYVWTSMSGTPTDACP